jgi:E3 ubiquitin-protein ligase ZNRF1/2
MGGRLTTPPSSASSSSTTAHRNTGNGSTTNLSHSRTNHHSQQHRHRSSSHQNAHGLFGQNPSNHNRHRTTSTNIDPMSSTFNFNLLRYVGLEHESDDPSSEDDSPHARRRLQRILIALRDVPCPVCNKTIPSDSFDKHIIQCLSKPRIDYNEDTLTENKGECVICLDDLLEGQKIARLPCLCIYHKSCIDNWFRINRTCPEHPGD